MSDQVAMLQPVKRSDRFLLWLSQHWLLAFNILWGAFVIGPWLAPVFMKVGVTGIGNGIYWFYQFFCHQLPERSYFLFGPQPMYSLQQVQSVFPATDPSVLRQFVGNTDFGFKVAYSDRMVAMYTAFWFASIGFTALRRRIRPLPIWGYILMLLPMAIDGGTHFLSDLQAGVNFGSGFRDTNVWLAQLTNNTFSATFYAGDGIGSFNSIMRILTGVLFGLASVWLAWPYAEAAFAEAREELEYRWKKMRDHVTSNE